MAKVVCDGISSGPRPRPVPQKEKKNNFLGGFDSSEDSDSLLRSNAKSDEVSINFIIFLINDFTYNYNFNIYNFLGSKNIKIICKNYFKN